METSTVKALSKKLYIKALSILIALASVFYLSYFVAQWLELNKIMTSCIAVFITAVIGVFYDRLVFYSMPRTFNILFYGFLVLLTTLAYILARIVQLNFFTALGITFFVTNFLLEVSLRHFVYQLPCEALSLFSTLVRIFLCTNIVTALTFILWGVGKCPPPIAIVTSVIVGMVLAQTAFFVTIRRE